MEEKTKLDRIEEKLNELAEAKKEKKKSFWMPISARVGKNKVKNNWATYMIVNDNRSVRFVKLPIVEQTVVVDETPRIATAEDALSYKGKPFYIQPSWSVKPWNPSEHYQKTYENRTIEVDGKIVNVNDGIQGYRLLLNRIKNEAIVAKKKISGALVFGIIAVVIVAGYFAFKSGLFK